MIYACSLYAAATVLCPYLYIAACQQHLGAKEMKLAKELQHLGSTMYVRTPLFPVELCFQQYSYSFTFWMDDMPCCYLSHLGMEHTGADTASIRLSIKLIV